MRPSSDAERQALKGRVTQRRRYMNSGSFSRPLYNPATSAP